MSAWDPHRDLMGLLDALGRELVASGGPEVQAACFDDGDSILTAARDVRELIGTLIDDPDDSEAGVRRLETAAVRELLARQH
jgi:hypothetical protein